MVCIVVRCIQLSMMELFRGRLSEERDAKMASYLQETKIHLKPNDECTVAVKRLVEFNTKSMICGHEYNSDACQGDSGGPIFIETDPNRYEVFGVVSFGEGKFLVFKFPVILQNLTLRMCSSFSWNLWTNFRAKHFALDQELYQNNTG